MRWKDGKLSNYPNLKARINAILEDPAGGVWVTRSRIQDGRGPLCHISEERVQCFGSRDGISIPYAGPLFRDMSGPCQKHLASALLAAGLSQTGYIKAVTIMSLKDVLNEMENDSGERRNPGWRVEGHHVSQNYISHPLENATHNTIRSYDDCHEAR